MKNSSEYNFYKQENIWKKIFAFLGLLFMTFIFGMGPSSFVIFLKQTDITQANIEQHDRLSGGLISPNFDNKSCNSRYKSSMYRKPSPFPASPYLKQKLRNYEEYHKKCGPGTKNYQIAIEQLKTDKSFENAECQYVIWTECCGIGNRMLSLTSTFLFALLTNRVMLLELSDGMHDLFCEPFPESSWVLPSDFPIKNFGRFHAPYSYSSVVKDEIIDVDLNTSTQSLPAFVFLHLFNVKFRLVSHVFCENDHKIFRNINWVGIRSESYFAVSFFLMPMYKEELANMFPVKDSVFHILGRYLFHPSNKVWGLIRRYYEGYLADVDERIGLQIRIFPEDNVPFEKMFDRILECSRNTNLLPELGPANQTNHSYDAKKRKAILVVSLFSKYYEKVKVMYYENSTVTGETVAVYQPTHEENEKNSAKSHNQKALAEIFLLSYCDKIAITSRSTFGYVSYSLGGLRPLIIRSPGWMQHGLEGACVRSESIEPCLQSAPILTCNQKEGLTGTELIHSARTCEDVIGGLKLFDN